MASCRNDVPVILCVSSFAEGCFAVTVLWGSGFEVFVCCERALLVEVLGVAVLSKQVFIIFLYVCAVQAKRTPKIIKMIPSIPEEIVNNPTSIKDNAMMVQVLWIDFAFFLVRFSFLTISSYCALLSAPPWPSSSWAQKQLAFFGNLCYHGKLKQKGGASSWSYMNPRRITWSPS